MLLALAVLSLELLTGVQAIDVAICNPDGISGSVISSAEAETEVVFRPVRVHIAWHACDTSLSSEPRGRASTFFIRLWNNRRARTVGAASLGVMGESFVEGRHGGTTADVYLRAVRAMADDHLADPKVLLGFVVAHELGHLLLGPGHTPGGLMQAVWGPKEIEEARQRQLRFTKEDAERIRLALGRP